MRRACHGAEKFRARHAAETLAAYGGEMRTLYALLHGVRVAGQAAHVVVTAALYLSLVAATRPNGKPGQAVGRIAP